MIRPILLVTTLLFPSLCHAADGSFDRTRPCGFEEITVSTAATGVTPPATCTPGVTFTKKAMCSVAGASIRMRLDGTNPDTNTGHVVTSGSFIYLNNPKDIADVALIRDDSTDAEVSCTYRH